MSANGVYVDIPQDPNDDTQVLIAKAKPMAQPDVGTTKVVDATAEAVTVTTGIDEGYTNVNGLLVKVSMERE
jgi:hypothetical protein